MAFNKVTVEKFLTLDELDKVQPATREFVRAVVDKSLDKPQDFESLDLVDMWFDGMHSRVYHLVKAFCGHNQLPVRSWDDPEHRECLKELTREGTPEEPGPPQPLYVWYLKDLLENTALRVCGCHFEAVYHEEELFRRCVVDYLWVKLSS